MTTCRFPLLIENQKNIREQLHEELNVKYGRVIKNQL